MKMHRVNLLVIFILSVFCARAQETTRYALNINEFNELKVVNSINVDYRCNPDSAGMAVFETTPDRASMLIFSNPKGTLEVQTADGASAAGKLPTVTVYSSFLNKVENSGDSTVRVLTVAPCSQLTANVIGNGHLVVRNIKSTRVNGAIKTGNGLLILAGKCDDARYTFYGTGVIQADQLEAAEVTVKASGTGSIGVWAVNKLSVYGLGSSKIYYRGKPEIKKSSVGIKIEPLMEK